MVFRYAACKIDHNIMKDVVVETININMSNGRYKIKNLQMDKSI